MSSAPAARSARSAYPWRAATPESASPPLRLVPAYRRSTAPRAPFVVLVVTLLGLGLIVLLLLNTTLAQDSFRLAELRGQTAELRHRQEALEREIADLAAPHRLAEAARRLGLRPSDDLVFLRTPEGEVVVGSGEG